MHLTEFWLENRQVSVPKERICHLYWINNCIRWFLESLHIKNEDKLYNLINFGIHNNLNFTYPIKKHMQWKSRIAVFWSDPIRFCVNEIRLSSFKVLSVYPPNLGRFPDDIIYMYLIRTRKHFFASNLKKVFKKIIIKIKVNQEFGMVFLPNSVSLG